MIGLLGKGPGDLFAQSRAEPRKAVWHKAFAALLLLSFVSACEEPAANQLTPDPVSRGVVGPASGNVTGQDTINNFAVCINTAPTFSRAESQLRAMPFNQNSATGTWYHETLNLSIKVSSNSCSMVFASDEKPGVLGLALAVGSTEGDSAGQANIGLDPETGAARTNARGGTQFLFAPAGQVGGKSYYRAVMTN